MHCWPGPEDRINSFALVSYIPGVLGDFLDGLRRELVSGCVAQSHVSVLPPREVRSEHDAAAQLERQLSEFRPFTLELGPVAVFEKTSVVYLELRRGQAELLRLHDFLNTGELASAERFDYYPHVTLAQEFDPADLESVRRTAELSWSGYHGPRTFEVDCLTFVQNTERNRWLDLRSYSLQGAFAGAERR